MNQHTHTTFTKVKPSSSSANPLVTIITAAINTQNQPKKMPTKGGKGLLPRGEKSYFLIATGTEEEFITTGLLGRGGRGD